MTTGRDGHPFTVGGKAKKALAVSAASLLLGLGAAVPVLAMPLGGPDAPSDVRPGKSISVFNNLDFVAAFGYPVGEELTVQVFRNDVLIGQAVGPAVDADAIAEGVAFDGALEVNHGPEVVPPAQGDCWVGHTPDILPGDRVKVTDSAGGIDELLVDDISISGPPREDLSTADTSDVILEGRAAYADGTPIPVERLDSGEIRSGSRFRANPNTITRTPGTTDGWTATYRAPYGGESFRNRDNLDLDGQKQTILDGDHAMGYGHVAPLPPETQLAEGVGGGGPAPGCEALAPKQANAVASTDDEAVNIGSEDLVVGGFAMADVAAVTGTVEDTAGYSVPFDATGSLSAGPGEKTWQVTIPRTDLDELVDGPLTISGSYAIGGSSIEGATKTIDKDVVAPDITADPASGTTATQPFPGVGLSLVGGEDLEIRYTTDGSDPNRNSRLYDGRRIPLGVGSHTIKAASTDDAGNTTVESFTYAVNPRPVVTPPPPPPAGGPIVGTPGNDVLRGTSRNDVINGGGGNDTIIGGGGNDRINGGPGNDTLRGGSGVDTIVGGTGLDRLYGDAGNDRLNSRDGKPRDLLNGGSGRDTASSDRGDVRRALP